MGMARESPREGCTLTMEYEQKAYDLALMYGIEICFKCKCRGAGYEMGHSRAHAHTREMKVCLDAVPRGYRSFFTFLHELGHCLAPHGSYYNAKTRAVAEHNATEWAKVEMRKLGLPLKRKVIAQYDAYIKNKVERGLRRGLQVVPAEVRKYLKK